MRCRTANGPAIRFARNFARIATQKHATPQRSGPLNVLVVGGSLGAAALNEVVPKALALLAPTQRPRVVHQAGAKHIDALRANYAAAGLAVGAECELVPFIDDMASAYAERRSGDLPRRRDDRVGDGGGRRGGVVRAVPVCSRRSPDHQRRVPRRQRRGAGRCSNAICRRKRSRLVAQPDARDARGRWRSVARALAKPDATERVAPDLRDVAAFDCGREPRRNSNETHRQTHSLRRHRRRRHERHRRGAAQPRLSGQRLGPGEQCGHRAPRRTGRARSRSATRRRTSKARTRWSCRPRCAATIRKCWPRVIAAFRSCRAR